MYKIHIVLFEPNHNSTMKTRNLVDTVVRKLSCVAFQSMVESFSMSSPRVGNIQNCSVIHDQETYT